jgi:hypothetical protein
LAKLTTVGLSTPKKTQSPANPLPSSVTPSLSLVKVEEAKKW